MVVVERIKDIPVLSISGKTGKPNGIGVMVFGGSHLGDDYKQSGIYRRNGRWRNQKIVKMKHYEPTNPQTTVQQARRSKFADGVAQWHLLSDNDKMLLRKKASKINMTGFNLFMRKWMNKI